MSRAARRRAVRWIARVGAAAALATAMGAPLLPTSGCIASCPTVDRYYERGETLIAPNGAGVYETSPSDGAFLPFEGGTVWHLHHGLGRVPTSVQVYTSFAENPNQTFAGGSSPGAGNETLVLDVDDQNVVVKNDTCSGFYLRVVVTADVPLDAGAADASGDADAGDGASQDATAG